MLCVCVMEPKQKTLYIFRTKAFYSLGCKIVVEAPWSKQVPEHRGYYQCQKFLQ